ncbi:translation elongation factor Ts [Rheinheimera baltica]|uniref:Elongation factor Ts n=1 Tax=Rheinheimera baltica TaxID=67576 RepID=A0ABT9HXP6_9GAMM|nr:translation elongation factor Ts [Rheinheimera baltica]MDP5135911.1 translation elongation factor Ts [Rheinheimera baltica]MDP5150261.1 translation elongation factor Ts [Rheinheimera baltica]
MAVTAALVKELRERTGAGMMDCKKALEETAGDIEAAIDAMRKSGLAKAAKKAGRIAAEGTIITRVADGLGLAVEFNCETDFVARDASFLAFANAVADLAHANKLFTAEAILAADLNGTSVEDTRATLVAKIGENINVRRAAVVEGAVIGQYVHSGRIGVLAVLDGGNEDIAKDVAMHIAANNPGFLTPDDVPSDVVDREREIQIDIAVNSGKPKEIAEKMVAGRMSKFTGEVSLTGQPFVKDPSVSVGDFLKQSNAKAVSFIRLEVGEGIEKKEEDFAAEVAAQIAAAKK